MTSPSREGPPSVCLYTPSADASGMGVHMVTLAERFLAHRIDVSVMYWPTPATETVLARSEAMGATLLRTPHPRDPAYAGSITDALAARSPDLFHVHVGFGREDFGGARAARAAGVPVVQTLHLPWLLSSRRARTKFFRSIEAVDRLIAVSEAQRATYLRLGVPGDRLVTVPNGVSPRGVGPGRVEARRRLGLAPLQPVVLSVGRLTRMKGHRHLVDALPALVRRFPGVTAVVVGEGPLRGDLVAQAERLGVTGALRLVGHRDDARELLDAADVFVLPSRHEGMPLALLEAMDAGLPAVATRVIGAEETVAHGTTGLLVAPEDGRALADALGELLADASLSRSCARAATRRYAESFTSERMASATREVYAGLVPVLRHRPVPVRDRPDGAGAGVAQGDREETSADRVRSA